MVDFMKKPCIVLTNDDGIGAQGIKNLWEILKDHFEIIVVAPSSEMSGSSVSITFSKPIQYKKVQWYDNQTVAWSINGTPADCVNLAFNVLLNTPPVMVLSGINFGSNAGRSVLYSGTIGAAIVSVIQGVPSIAISYASSDSSSKYLSYVKSIVDFFVHNVPPKGTYINVNIPPGDIKGYRLTQQGNGLWVDDIKVHMIKENNFSAKLINGRFIGLSEHHESDVELLSKGYITATPIDIFKLTNFEHLQEQRRNFEKIPL
jgi:5'-nucleotidase